MARNIQEIRNNINILSRSVNAEGMAGVPRGLVKDKPQNPRIVGSLN